MIVSPTRSYAPFSAHRCRVARAATSVVLGDSIHDFTQFANAHENFRNGPAMPWRGLPGPFISAPITKMN